MAKKYMVYRNGSITIRGASVDIKIGDFVKESVFRNYPNYIYEIDDAETDNPTTPVDEETTKGTDSDVADKDESVKDETSADESTKGEETDIDETPVDETVTEAKPKRGKNK